MDFRIVLLFLSLFLRDLTCIKLLYTNPVSFCLVTFDPDLGNLTTQFFGGNFNDVSSFDIYRDENVIYWSDDAGEVVKRYQKVDSHEEVDQVLSNLDVTPEHLAVDWIGGKLYWVGSERNTIEVSNLDGTYRKVLIWDDIIEARSIALHPMKRLLFWTDCGHYPRVGRAGMDGSERSVVMVMNTCVFWPNSLSIDYSEDRIYFADERNGKLFSYLIDGTALREIAPRGLANPSHVSVSWDFIFWVNWKNLSISYCPKEACLEGKYLTSTGSTPKDFKVVQPERSLPAHNPCGVGNGGCSHLCLLSPSSGGYSCACPVGIKMTQDGRNCAAGPSEILLVVRQVDLRWVSLDTPDFTNFVVPLPQVKHAVDVTFDPIHGKVYWSDFELQSIMGAYLNGSGLDVVVNASTIRPEGVALDWRGRNLFWIDSGKDRIQVTQLDGLFDKVIIDTGLLEPRAITIDPMNGRMFWSDWGNKSKLEMSFMDGSERRILVDSDITWPNGLALDQFTNRLYWGDAGKDLIAYIKLDTMERVTLLEGISHAFGLAVLNDYIYWSDPTERLISRADKETGLNRSRIVESLPNLMSLKAVSLHGNTEENQCYRNNGGCSHFCFMRGEHRVCACPDELELLYDDTDCHLPHLFLIYATSLTIHRVSIVTGLDARLVSGVGAKGIKAITTDPLRKKIYWSYAINKSIHVVNLNPTHIGRVISNVDAEDIAVDYLSNHLYWSDLLTNRIEMMKLEERSRSVVVWKDVVPSRLAVDPENGWLFWINVKGESSIIERSRLNGDSRKVIISGAKSDISRLAVDTAGKHLYWLQGNSLLVSDYDGENRTLVYESQVSLSHDFGILNDSLFLLRSKEGKIVRANKSGRIDSFPVGSDVVGMSILDVSRDMDERPDACRTDNGGCSHFCINMGYDVVASPSSRLCQCDAKDAGRPHEYANRFQTGISDRCSCLPSRACTCPTHYSLLDDGLTCKAPETYLLLGQNNSILRLPVDQSPEDTVEVHLHTWGIRSVKSMKHDPRERKIFWIDNRNKSLKSLSEVGQVSILLHSIIIIDIALDSHTQLVYFTERSCNCIQVVRYNGTHLGTVVSEGQPMYLAIAPRAGYLFWTNRGKTPKLERSQLDGSSKIILINTGLGQLGPIEVDDHKSQRSSRSMSANHRNGKIYWIDLDLRRIESADFEGNNRVVVVHDTEAEGLAVFGSWLLWATKDGVERVNTSDGSRRVKIWSGLPYVTAIALVVTDRGDRDVGDLCPTDTCSHFCVKEDEEIILGDTASMWRCSCPIGKQLVENTCKEPVACNDSQFTCHSNGMCIPLKWRCDQHPDCEDKSDEADCRNCSKGKCTKRIKSSSASPKCEEDMQTCANLQCVTLDRWCDGIPDCADSSDELDCPPMDKEVQKMSNAYYAVGLGIASAGIVLIACILLLAFICRQKSRNLATAYADNIVMVARPSPPPLSLPDSSTMLLGSGDLCPQKNDGDCAARLNNNRTIPGSSKSYFGELDDDMTFFDSSIVFRDCAESGASESVFYDRGHITGASSTTGSALTSRPAFDPPPSPITDRSLTCISPSIPSYGQARSSGRYRYNTSAGNYDHGSHRPRRRRKRHKARHLPTPCSSTTEEGTLCDHYLFAPPPPTPLSGFSLSGDLKNLDISYPPSPSTGRSLYPPPPPSSLRCLSEEEYDDDDDDDDDQEHENCNATCSNKTEK